MSYLDVLKKKKADIDVYYKMVDSLNLPLQVFLPEGFDETKQYKTVIAIHGGAWHSLKETPSDWDGGWMGNTAKYYAKKGYVGIVFTYRDIDLGDVGDILNDCYDAIAYIKTNFSFVDDENAVFMGDSAGGHLALCLAMHLPEGSAPAIQPKKVAAYNPVTDCVSEKWSYCAKDSIKYSPMHHAQYIDADILVMHGTNDTVVSIEDSRLFTEKMKNAGNRISMVEVPEATHAFILFGFQSEEQDVLAALDITDEYLHL